MTRSGRWMAAVLAALVVGNVVFLLVGRDRPDRPRTGVSAPSEGGAPTAGAASPTGNAPTEGAASPTESAPAATSPTNAPPGDAPPNHAGNNAWKQRHELTAEERATGDALMSRIRPGLEALRVAGDFTPASTERVLLGARLEPDAVTVTPMQAASPGTVFAVTFPQRGCVIGSVRPDQVRIQVTGSAAEFGCLEPSSH